MRRTNVFFIIKKQVGEDNMHIKRVFLSFIVIIISLFFKEQIVEAYEIRSGIDSFPESYQPYLRELQKKHPNWNFKSLYTGLYWTDVINAENVFGKNLVPKSYSDRWKNTTPGQYNVSVDGDWVDCSRQAIEFAMDPRNFLNEVRLFQFENLSADIDAETRDSVEKILYGTEFYNTKVNYLDAYGNRIYTDKYYSDLIVDASKVSGVSSFHLASHIKQEVGPFLSHKSISGDVEGYRGLYNFYNIGATSSTAPLGAIKNGLQYARDGKDASQYTRDKYLIPWDTKAKGITGGAIFIGSSYINRGQNTVYLQKFHVVDNTGSSLFWHQYMTNVLDPYGESKLTYNGYANNNLLGDQINFLIPVYYNMPNLMTESPSINPYDYQDDNTKMIANVSTSLNVRSGPGTQYETITRAYSQEKMTRISKGIGSGELWDRVILDNGIVGYVFQYYLKEEPQTTISQIDLSLDKDVINKGEIIKLNVNILPLEAGDQKVIFSSSNTSVALVDEKGNILGVGKGKATIIATAENSSVYNQIEVEVYSPVTGLELSDSKKVLQVGSGYTIVPSIFPDDANNKEVSYTSTDSNIATVNELGKVTAVTEGNCEIVVKTKEGDFEKRVEIKVIEPIVKEELYFDESLRIEGDEISGIVENSNTVAKFKDKITTIYEIEIENAKGELLDENMLVGTGSIVNIVDKTGDILVSYKLIVYGDVNGDGRINSIDLLVLQRHILEIERLKGVFYKAGNINKNGKKPSSLDSLLIQRHILGIKLIEQ